MRATFRCGHDTLGHTQVVSLPQNVVGVAARNIHYVHKEMVLQDGSVISTAPHTRTYARNVTVNQWIWCCCSLLLWTVAAPLGAFMSEFPSVSFPSTHVVHISCLIPYSCTFRIGPWSWVGEECGVVRGLIISTEGLERHSFLHRSTLLFALRSDSGVVPTA